MTDKGGFGAVLDSSEIEHQAFTICESGDHFSLLSEKFVRERQQFDGKKAAPLRRRPCLSCETWPKPTFHGCCRGWGCAIAAVAAEGRALRARAGWSSSRQNIERSQ